MKILLLSDTHGDDQIMFDLKRLYPNMDLYLHAGDSLSDECTIHPFISVNGNCDYYPFPEFYRVATPIGYLLMRHLPYFDAKQIADNKILIHGHTHKIKVNLDGDKIFLCPGSPNLPKDETEGTYMILDLKERGSFVYIHDIETKNILYTYEIR